MYAELPPVAEATALVAAVINVALAACWILIVATAVAFAGEVVPA